MSWPIGISTGMFYKRPIMQVLPLIAGAGFDTIEVTCSPSHFDWHDERLVSSIKSELDDLGIRVYSIHAPWTMGVDMAQTDERKRKAAVEETKSAIDAAAALGAGTVVIHPGGDEPIASTRHSEHLHASLSSLKGIRSYCSELGLALALEGMLPHLLGGSLSDFLWLLKSLPAEGVSVCLDTGHAFLGGELFNMVELVRSQLSMLHVSDNMGAHDDHLTPGQGTINWKRLGDALRSAQFDGILMLELACKPGNEHILFRARRSTALISGGS